MFNLKTSTGGEKENFYRDIYTFQIIRKEEDIKEYNLKNVINIKYKPIKDFNAQYNTLLPE